MTRPFAVYPDSFDGDTLGWWRFGERGGRLDGVIGPAFTNFGADPTDRGYHFVRANTDYMDAAFAGQPQRSQLTFECWVPGWWQAVPDPGWTYSEIANFYIDVDNSIAVRTLRHDPTTQSRILAWLRIGGVEVGRLLWQGVVVDALLTSEDRWHVAIVLDSPNSFRLFVNGELKEQDLVGIADLPEGNYTLRLGRYLSGSTFPLDGILDEVRLSTAARYAATFPITRFQDGRRLGLRGPEVMATAGGIP